MAVGAGDFFVEEWFWVAYGFYSRVECSQKMAGKAIKGLFFSFSVNYDWGNFEI